MFREGGWRRIKFPLFHSILHFSYFKKQEICDGANSVIANRRSDKHVIAQRAFYKSANSESAKRKKKLVPPPL